MELGGRAGLGAEAAEVVLAGPEPRVDDLERHAAAQRLALGLVDHAHASLADRAKDPVVAQPLGPWGGTFDGGDPPRSPSQPPRFRWESRLRLWTRPRPPDRPVSQSLDLDQRREDLADLGLESGVSPDELVQRTAALPCGSGPGTIPGRPPARHRPSSAGRRDDS